MKNNNLLTYKNIYFIGIGGIGMSALAKYFKLMGKNVLGYDKVPSRITKMLTNEGINIHFEENENILASLSTFETLVIYTPAIPDNHKELLFAKNNGYKLLKRAEVLGEISEGYKTIAVAGTHGKTTVTSMITHIFKTAGKKIVAFSGGLMSNYNSNFVYDEGAEYMIVEADEYDKSFLHLKNNFINIITAIDADHLDIYGNYENLLVTYKTFAYNLINDGLLVLNETLLPKFEASTQIITYGINKGLFHATNIDLTNKMFDVVYSERILKNMLLNVDGIHNVENAVAAFTAAYNSGIAPNQIKNALASFKGNWRRFEKVYENKNVLFIDDYAHHPREIEAVLESVKKMYPDRKVTVVFQPHLFSRTQDLAEDFAKVLSMADDIILLPIYPAREEPIKGITSEWLLNKIQSKNKVVIPKKELVKYLSSQEIDVLLTLGAGDIDREVDNIKQMLKNKAL